MKKVLSLLLLFSPTATNLANAALSDAAPAYTMAHVRLAELKNDFKGTSVDNINIKNPAYQEMLLLQFLQDLKYFARTDQEKAAITPTYGGLTGLMRYVVNGAAPFQKPLFNFFGEFNLLVNGETKEPLDHIIMRLEREIIEINETLPVASAIASEELLVPFTGLRTICARTLNPSRWSTQKKVILLLALVAAIYAGYKGVQGARWTWRNRKHLGEALKHFSHHAGMLHAREKHKDEAASAGSTVGRFGTMVSGLWRGLFVGNPHGLANPGVDPTSWWRIPTNMAIRGTRGIVASVSNHPDRAVGLAETMQGALNAAANGIGAAQVILPHALDAEREARRKAQKKEAFQADLAKTKAHLARGAAQ